MPPAESPSPPIPASHGFAGTQLACRRGERLIFARLDFSLASGGALILIGPNGSGKSSLLRLMAGLSRPARGTLNWDGAAITEDREAHCARLHFIGHADALKPLLTVEETLRFWAGMRRSEPPDPARLDAALARFGLERGAALPCRYLSAGQRRRLALARLVASPAPLWLLDEPTTGLDTEAAGQLLAAIAAHRRDGGSIVLSTHAPLEIADAAFLSLADYRPTRADLSLEFAA
jgi:heme exporter protein A